jgi:hypothetical protein
VKKKKSPRLRCSNKERYKVTNWPEYNRSLINRGRINLWLTPQVIEQWYYQGPKRKGRQPKYSDACIEMCLCIKVLFKLGFRQTQGFIESLLSLGNYDLTVPNFSDICKRSKRVKVKEKKSRKVYAGKTITLAADSTGLKVFGEGEWKVRKHGWGKHRTWQKLHLAVETDVKLIEGAVLTTNSVDDSSAVSALLEQAPNKVDTFIGDGAYDTMKVYETLTEKKIQAVIPPRKGARIRKHGNSKGRTHQRDRAIRQIRKNGRKQWKKKIKYHRRSIAETTMFRYKTIIGDKLKARTFDRQTTEIKIACKILNLMTLTGMPISVKIKASPTRTRAA